MEKSEGKRACAVGATEEALCGLREDVKKWIR